MMDYADTLLLRGALEIRVLKAGRLIDVFSDENMIMSAARNALALLVAGDGAGKVITKIGVGTSGEGPTPADNALAAPFIRNLSGHSFPALGRVRFDWTISTGEANGKIIREFGLITSDGTLFARKARPGIEKADDISLEGSWTIIF